MDTRTNEFCSRQSLRVSRRFSPFALDSFLSRSRSLSRILHFSELTIISRRTDYILPPKAKRDGRAAYVLAIYSSAMRNVSFLLSTAAKRDAMAVENDAKMEKCGKKAFSLFNSCAIPTATTEREGTVFNWLPPPYVNLYNSFKFPTI